MIDFISNNTIKNLFDQLRQLLCEQEDKISFTKKFTPDGPRKSLISLISYKKKTGIVDYQQYFNKFPINVINSENTINIKHYFYVYFLSGQSICETDDINATEFPGAFKFNHPESLKKPKGEFLYYAFRQKYKYLLRHFPSNLKYLAEEFHIDENNETSILLETIKLYTIIIGSKNEQIDHFKHVTLSKEISDLFTNILLEFFRLRLGIIEPNYKELYFANENASVIESPISEPTEYTNADTDYKQIDFSFPSNFNPNKKMIEVEKLPRKQAVLLFYLLRKKGVVKDYNNTVLSQFISYLTGYSKNTIRNEKGLGDISSIFNQVINGEEHFHPKELKKFLQEIISDLDKAIEK